LQEKIKTNEQQTKELKEAEKVTVEHYQSMIQSGFDYYDSQKSFGKQAGELAKQAIKQEIAKAVAQQIAKVIGYLPWPINLIAAPIAGLAAAALFESIVPKFATGTTNFGGGFATVGENGPELVQLPAGTNIYNHSQTAQIVDSASMAGFYYLARVIEEQFSKLDKTTGNMIFDYAAFDEGYQDYLYNKGKMSA